MFKVRGLLSPQNKSIGVETQLITLQDFYKTKNKFRFHKLYKNNQNENDSKVKINKK